MRACAHASLIAALCLPTAMMFSACASGSPPEASAPDGAKEKPEHPGDTKAETKPAEGAATPSANATTPNAPAATTTERKDPQTAADCKAVLSEIVNEPPKDGVVMNNAQPVEEGKSSRYTSMTDLVKSKRDAFRCCFDLWAKNNPGQRGKISFYWELSPDGTLKAANVVKEKSDVSAPEVESCMVDLAKSMTYPKSPNGQVTKFTMPFEFKAHR